ncbi:MAG: OmpA family protein, partial [Thiohalobacterales bacterium]
FRSWLTHRDGPQARPGDARLRPEKAGVVSTCCPDLMFRAARLFTGMGERISRAGKKTLAPVLASIVLALGPTGAHAVPPGTVISNTANAAFDNGGSPETRASNIVNTTTTLNLTPTDIEFFQYSPTGAGSTPMLSSPSGCSLGAPGGPFPPLGNPTYPGIGVLDTSSPVDLIAASKFHQGEPVFVEVRDANRNMDRNSRDTVQVLLDVAATGDLEQLELSETGIDTGVFVGYIQSAAPAATAYDCQLAISAENILRTSYVDIYDSTDSASSTALVDPLGTVFDSVTGAPVDGATVTILDALTGLPAQMFGDDGVSTFPATITSGGSATDSGGTTYNFPPGGYRFPFMAPGSYRIEVSSTVYDTPSTRTIAELQTLPNAPFALDPQASFAQNFVLVAGPPVNIDVPVDTIPSDLFLSKTAALDRAAIGDFIQYNLELTNNQSTVTAGNTVIRDILPVGFRYQKGSVRQDGSSGSEPEVSGDGRRLTFSLGNLAAGQSVRLSYVLEVTAGTQMGDAVNKATASDAAGTVSNTAKAIVFVEDDLISSRSFILGRVIQGNCEVAGPTEGTLQLRMQSASEARGLGQALTVTGANLAGQQLALAVELPGVLQYEHGSVRINGAPAADPETREGALWFTLPGTDAAISHTIEYRLTPHNTDVGDFTVRARAFTRDQDDLQQSTAWAINTIERPENREYFTVSRDDSGELTTRILNSRRYNNEPTVGTDLDGVAGVRLILEDGRYVITDEKGLYHFEGLEPGTHVVQIDPDSIPAHLEVFECEQNTRFAGDAYSQFADLRGGLIWRSDFYVREKAPLMGNIGIGLASSLDVDTIEYRVTVAGDTHEYRNLRTRVMLAEGLEYAPGSSRLDDAAISDPDINANVLTFNLGDRSAADWSEQLTFRTAATPAGQGELLTQAVLSFDTVDEKNRRTRPAVNSLRHQHGSNALQRYEYQARFDSLQSSLQPQQRTALTQFINGLVDKGIDRVTLIDNAGISGHADNLPIAERSRHLFKDNQALSLARAATVGQLVRDILDLKEQQVIIAGKGQTQPVADNNTEAGRAHNRRAELVITLSDEQSDAVLATGHADSGMQTVTISKTRTAASSEQQTGITLPVDGESVEYDRDWLDTAAPGLEWLSPATDYIPEIPSIQIAIKHDAAHRLELVLNGKPVDPINFDGMTRSTDKQRSITRWRGVDLKVGDNRFEVTAYDKAGSVTGTQSQVIHFSGMPVRAEFVEQYSQLQANGITPVVVAVRFYDRWGKPVRKGVIGKYRLNPPYVATRTVEALRKQPLSGAVQGETTYRIDSNGIALIGIEPTTRSGKAALTFEFNDNTARIPSIKRLATITKQQEQEINVWLKGT